MTFLFSFGFKSKYGLQDESFLIGMGLTVLFTDLSIIIQPIKGSDGSLNLTKSSIFILA